MLKWTPFNVGINYSYILCTPKLEETIKHLICIAPSAFLVGHAFKSSGLRMPYGLLRCQAKVIFDGNLLFEMFLTMTLVPSRHANPLGSDRCLSRCPNNKGGVSIQYIFVKYHPSQ